MNAAAKVLNQGVLSRNWVIAILFSRTKVSFLILLLSVIFSALSVIYVTNLTRNLIADKHKLVGEHEKLYLQWNQFLLEKTTLTTQARIEHIASAKLGMVLPIHKMVVAMDDER